MIYNPSFVSVIEYPFSEGKGGGEEERRGMFVMPDCAGRKAATGIIDCSLILLERIFV